MAYDVFISYLRKTGVDDARLLQQALKARGYEVFFDYASLRVGKFNEKIFEAINEAPVFILMLTEGVLDGCVNERDWVRAEIECAIDKRKRIIPVLPSDQKLSFPDNLPIKLRDIPYLQVSELNKASLFEESVDKIIQNCFPDCLNNRLVNVKARPRKILEVAAVRPQLPPEESRDEYQPNFFQEHKDLLIGILVILLVCVVVGVPVYVITSRLIAK